LVGWDENDRFSSVLVADGMTLVVYEHADFQGNSLTLVSPGVVDLGDFGFGDSISSIEVRCVESYGSLLTTSAAAS
jgi:hypothetical protein